MKRIAKNIIRLGLMLCLAIVLLNVLPAPQAHAVSLPAPAQDTALASQPGETSIVLAGGCFWGIQAVFEHVKGVKKATSGYAGGNADTAHYEMVSTGATGHAESVQVVYDPSQITLGKILEVYFSVAHNPTELDYQGPDHGTQYRSAIFFTTSEQKAIAQAYIDQLGKARAFADPIVTALEPLKQFYPAEGYHQDYAKLNPYNPYIAMNDLPKVESLKQEFPGLYVKD